MMEAAAGIGKEKPAQFLPPQPARDACAGNEICYTGRMKFSLAILVFLLFAFFLSWGIILLMHGSPWLLIAAVGVFLGTFIKYGCLSH
jgi:hypothetical protein